MHFNFIYNQIIDISSKSRCKVTTLSLRFTNVLQDFFHLIRVKYSLINLTFLPINRHHTFFNYKNLWNYEKKLNFAL